MKKIIAALALAATLTGLIPGVCAHAEPEATETAQTETQIPETEKVAVILPTDVVSTEDIVLFSSSLVVMDTDTGEFLYYKNPTDRHYPASITKVLTGLLLIENTDPEDVITYYDSCWDGLEFWTDMHIGMQNEEQLTVDQTLHAILMASANEVCNGAAEYLCGSVAAFADLMNETAKGLGCTDTHFVNPNGLHDPNHYTTARDMALISAAAIKEPLFKEIAGTQEYIVESTNKREEGFPLAHKHKMIMFTNYYDPSCVAGKTGYTPAAGNTLVTFVERDGHTLVCVLLENVDGHTYPDTIMALDYCFENYDALAAAMKDDPINQVVIPESETETETILEENIIELQEETQGPEDGSDSILPKQLAELKDRVILWSLDHLMIAIPVGTVITAVAILLLIWFVKVLGRANHRRKYNKLRKARMKDEE